MSTIKGSFTYCGSEFKYTISDEDKDRIVMRLLDYYSSYCWHEEFGDQDDNYKLDALSVLAGIADDIICFSVEGD